jgi:hypothetical protein
MHRPLPGPPHSCPLTSGQHLSTTLLFWMQTLGNWPWLVCTRYIVHERAMIFQAYISVRTRQRYALIASIFLTADLDSHRFLKFCYLDSRGAHSYWVWLTILLQKNSGSKPNRLQTNRIARRNSLVSRKSTGKYPTCTERSRLAIDCEIKLACT